MTLSQYFSRTPVILSFVLASACSQPEATAPSAPAAVAPVATAQPVAAPVVSEPAPSPQEIKAVVDENGTQIRQCYLVGTFKDAQLAGTVRVNFTIETDGKVSEALDDGSSMPDPDVVSCVLDVFAKLEFRPGGSSATNVTYPISFGSQG